MAIKNNKSTTETVRIVKVTLRDERDKYLGKGLLVIYSNGDSELCYPSDIGPGWVSIVQGQSYLGVVPVIELMN